MARKVKEVIEEVKVEEIKDKYLESGELVKLATAHLEEKIRKLELQNMQNQKDKIAAQKQLLTAQLDLKDKEIQIQDLKILIQTKQFDEEREAYKSFIREVRAKYDIKAEKFGFDLETARIVES